MQEITGGDVVSFRFSSAGGYGSPSEHDPKSIDEDIAEGYVTPAFAKLNYGHAAK